ncbi:hypothetical protein PM082_007613 [Marasmius tenuissimus]|nr:hypothetical protein PM082_007613 [Marasmius tenuissimus]
MSLNKSLRGFDDPRPLQIDGYQCQGPLSAVFRFSLLFVRDSSMGKQSTSQRRTQSHFTTLRVYLSQRGIFSSRQLLELTGGRRDLNDITHERIGRFRLLHTIMQEPKRLLCERCSSPIPFENIPDIMCRSGEPVLSLTGSDEVARLRTTLRVQEETRESYAEQIACLQQRLKILETERAAVEDRIAHCRSALSAQSLRRVPVEIWELIFTHACGYPSEYSLTIDYDVGDYPDRTATLEVLAITLSQVCSRWRSIMKSCPNLWSSLRVGLAELPFNIEVPLRASLENSNGRPLRLFITGDPLPYPSFKFSEQSKAAWAILSDSISRCKELVLNIPDSDAFPSFPSNLSLPYLDTYHEESYCSGDAVDAPSHVSLLPTDFIDDLGSQRQRNRTFHCDPAYMPESRNPDHPGLDAPGVDLDGIKQTDVLLPSLRELSILDDHGEYDPDNAVLLTLLSCLSMPSLVSFEMNAHDWPVSNVLLSMLRRSSVLERVTLDFNGGSPTEETDVSQYSLFPLLDALSSLKHFEFALAFSSFECPHHLDQSRVLRKRFVNGVVSHLLSQFQADVGTSGSSFLPRIESLHLRLSELASDTIKELRGKVRAVISSRACFRDLELALYDQAVV